MMKTRAGLLLAGFMLWTGIAHANESCTLTESGIVQFRPAEFSVPSLWNAAVGVRISEFFQDGIALDDGSVIAGGYYLKPLVTEEAEEKDKPEEAKKETDDAAAAPIETLAQSWIARVARHGKILWQVRGESAVPQKIMRVIQAGDQVVALGGMEAPKTKVRRVQVIAYDLEGKRQKAFVLSEGDGHLDPVAILPVDGGGYYIAAQYENLRVQGQKFGVLYKTDQEGKRLWRRAYTPGLTTGLQDMIRTRDGDMVLVGTLRGSDGRESGWVVRIDGNGNLKWQKQFSRGRASQFLRVAAAPDGYVIGGVSDPLAGERTGAWIIKVTHGGEMLWERFFNGPDDYRAASVSVLGDGRTAALIGALPQGQIEDGQFAHARLLLLSPRGETLEAQSFSGGEGFWPGALLNAGASPVLIGSVREIPPDPPPRKVGDPPPPSPPVIYDGWIAALQTPPAYDDPCVAR